MAPIAPATKQALQSCIAHSDCTWENLSDQYPYPFPDTQAVNDVTACLDTDGPGNDATQLSSCIAQAEGSAPPPSADPLAPVASAGATKKTTLKDFMKKSAGLSENDSPFSPDKSHIFAYLGGSQRSVSLKGFPELALTAKGIINEGGIAWRSPPPLLSKFLKFDVDLGYGHYAYRSPTRSDLTLNEDRFSLGLGVDSVIPLPPAKGGGARAMIGGGAKVFESILNSSDVTYEQVPVEAGSEETVSQTLGGVPINGTESVQLDNWLGSGVGLYLQVGVRSGSILGSHQPRRVAAYFTMSMDSLSFSNPLLPTGDQIIYPGRSLGFYIDIGFL